MKTIIITSVLLSCAFLTNAQDINPFESIGKKGKILTLSNGKYTEVHINDSLQRIGSVIVNMNTGTIYELLDIDTLYSEATLDPTIISRFYSVDPAASLFPNESPYMFAGNNPIFYIDEDGKWKVSFRNNNDHSAGIVLVAEPGDNLQTLAVQMGIPYKDLVDQNFGGNDFTLNASLKGGEWLRQEDLLGVEVFQNINNYLKEGKDNPDFNCASFCIFGIEGEVDGWVDPDNMDDQLRQAYINLKSENDARMGDVITFTESFEEFDFMWGGEAASRGQSREEFQKYYNEEIKNRGAHYSIVLLKSQDGQSIRYTIQKSGITPVKISGYPGQSPSYEKGREGWPIFTPSPINEGDQTPVYRKEESSN